MKKDCLKNTPCFIIGAGPSLIDVDLSILEGVFSIGTNRAFYKIDPTILIWQDQSFWQLEKKNILKTKALKFCRNSCCSLDKNFITFKLQNSKPKIPQKIKTLYGRGNSSSIAFQLACFLGCDPIILVGIDCKYIDGKTNFHEKNKKHTSRTLPKCKESLNWIKSFEKQKTIINCSKNDTFENKNLVDVINNLNCDKKSREYYNNLLGDNF